MGVMWSSHMSLILTWPIRDLSTSSFNFLHHRYELSFYQPHCIILYVSTLSSSYPQDLNSIALKQELLWYLKIKTMRRVDQMLPEILMIYSPYLWSPPNLSWLQIMEPLSIRRTKSPFDLFDLLQSSKP